MRGLGRAAGALPIALVLLGALLTGCGGSQQRSLTVLAAASLTESFDELGERFHAEHPDVELRFDYQGSSTLAEQLEQGRRADVFASADPSNMGEVLDGVGVERPPAVFATNQLVLVVPKDNPAHIRSTADLAGTEVVVCAPEVPCGAAAERAARAAGIRLRPVSEENDVKSVLRKVAEGEADAGFVYRTDALSERDAVRTVDSPEVTTSYPIVVPRGAPDPDLAAEFVSFVRGPVGREVLAEHGFGTP